MSLKSVTRDLKPHIGVFGRRNVGKSTLVNILTGQNIAIVSDIAGTTTDPVKRTTELLNFGPVVIIDTAGIDDNGILGQKRIDRTLEITAQVDMALLLITDNIFGIPEEELIEIFTKNDTPYTIIYTKSDVTVPNKKLEELIISKYDKNIIRFSSIIEGQTESIISSIKQSILPTFRPPNSLLGDLIGQDDIVLLLTPIDSEAPAGRLILPQVQTIRDLLDNRAIAIVMQPTEVSTFLKTTGIKPKLVIADSQLFNRTNTLVPDDIPLTGYSIILARHKGNFNEYIKGTPMIDNLKNGDRVLILESCTHQVSCEDIGRKKIPRMMREYTNKSLDFDIVSGLTKIERRITDYSLVVQCGGCMITQKQLQQRLKSAIEADIPVTNYGMAIAYMHGYYHRVMAPFM